MHSRNSTGSVDGFFLRCALLKNGGIAYNTGSCQLPLNRSQTVICVRLVIYWIACVIFSDLQIDAFVCLLCVSCVILNVSLCADRLSIVFVRILWPFCRAGWSMPVFGARGLCQKDSLSLNFFRYQFQMIPASCLCSFTAMCRSTKPQSFSPQRVDDCETNENKSNLMSKPGYWT